MIFIQPSCNTQMQPISMSLDFLILCVSFSLDAIKSIWLRICLLTTFISHDTELFVNEIDKDCETHQDRKPSHSCFPLSCLMRCLPQLMSCQLFLLLFRCQPHGLSQTTSLWQKTEKKIWQASMNPKNKKRTCMASHPIYIVCQTYCDVSNYFVVLIKIIW